LHLVEVLLTNPSAKGSSSYSSVGALEAAGSDPGQRGTFEIGKKPLFPAQLLSSLRDLAGYSRSQTCHAKAPQALQPDQTPRLWSRNIRRTVAESALKKAKWSRRVSAICCPLRPYRNPEATANGVTGTSEFAR